jgi:hypothetical protein
MRKVISVTQGADLLEKTSVAAKFGHALRSIQDEPDSITGRVALLLFPELFQKRRLAI